MTELLIFSHDDLLIVVGKDSEAISRCWHYLDQSKVVIDTRNVVKWSKLLGTDFVDAFVRLLVHEIQHHVVWRRSGCREALIEIRKKIGFYKSEEGLVRRMDGDERISEEVSGLGWSRFFGE